MKNNQNTVTRKKLQDYSYCLTHNIGKGYSSQVYKGRNDITDQTVAIKVIDMRMLKGQVHKNLLSSQIQVLQSFKNAKNIIQVFQIYSTKNNTYIITQFCEGGDLSRFISSRRGLPQSQAVNLLKQIGQGYSQIYSNRIIHRDLKPANILLKQNKVKIADFGFAMKSTQSKKYSSYNVGSPIYMPPQALNDNKYSYKSDIWAIGVIFFQLLTGRTPWKAKTQKQLAKQLSTIPISKLIPKNISQTSCDFLQKALTVNFQKRMNPEELDRYMEIFDRGFGNTNSNLPSNISNNPNTHSTYNPHRPQMVSQQRHQRHDSTLNKNTVNTPKNARRFTFLKTGQDLKNLSIPKTASTTNDHLQINSDPIDKKQISKELLSQIHFCRFVYKLIQRIDTTIDGNMSQQLRTSMNGILFQKLECVQNLSCLESSIANQYKKSSDYQKIRQIVNQYISKYRKDIGIRQLKWLGYQTFETEIISQIKSMYKQIQSQSLEKVKNHVIILDYFVTLKQLVNLLQKNNIQLFHGKSKIQAIVEGSPAKVITGEHIRAITAKLRAIKII